MSTMPYVDISRHLNSGLPLPAFSFIGHVVYWPLVCQDGPVVEKHQSGNAVL